MPIEEISVPVVATQGTQFPATTVTIPVSGMTCAACQSFVQKTLIAQPGVRNASVNLMMHSATVAYDPQTSSVQALVEAIRKTGYEAALPAQESNAIAEQEKLEQQQVADYHSLRRKAAVSLVAGAVAMIVSMPLMSSGPRSSMTDPLLSWFMRTLDPATQHLLPALYQVPPATLRIVLLVLASVIMAWAGKRFYTKAWSALRHGTADMNSLVALGTGTAFLYSLTATVLPSWFSAQRPARGRVLRGRGTHHCHGTDRQRTRSAGHGPDHACVAQNHCPAAAHRARQSR